MKVDNLVGSGVIGVEVKFNNLELMVIKEFIGKLKPYASEEGKRSAYDFMTEVKPLLKDVVVLLGKIIPEDVMSMDGVHDGLFKDPVILAPNVNYELSEVAV